MEWLKIQKLKYLENRTFFYEIKKFLTCASDNAFRGIYALISLCFFFFVTLCIAVAVQPCLDMQIIQKKKEI